MKVLAFCFLVAVALRGSTAAAENLSLDKAIKIAVQNNFDARAALYNLQAAQEKVAGGYAALLAAALPTPTRSNPREPTTYLTNRASMIEYEMMHIAGEFGHCINGQ